MPEWSETAGRAIVYARSGRTCEVCGRPAESVHHRVKHGRRWNPGNLLSLCGDGVRRCHGFIEAHPRFAMLLGLWVPAETDPLTIPMYVKPEQFGRTWWLADDDGMWHHAGEPPTDRADAGDRADAVRQLHDARIGW